MINKIKREIKNNPYTSILFLIFLVLFIIGAIAFTVIMPSTGKPSYGNRLDGIEKVEITDKQKDAIVTSLEQEKVVVSAKTHISGKIINVIVEVKEGTKTSTAKNLTKKITSNLEKDQISFYDIQIFITNAKTDTKGYPIIGYKNSSASKFTF